MAADHPYPLFLNLAGQPVLVVGAGTVGWRKAQGVLASGGRVTVVSPQFSAAWLESSANAVCRIQETYKSGPSGHIASGRWRLVFAATNLAAVNESVAADAAAANILCCRCDVPEHGDFSGGAVDHQTGITLAVSTNGSSPLLARRVRDALADSLDPVFGQWAQLLSVWRPQVLTRVANPEIRQNLLRQIAGTQMEETLRAHGYAGAQELFDRLLTGALTANVKEVPHHAG